MLGRAVLAGTLGLAAAFFAAPEVRAEHLVAVVATKGSPHQPFGLRVEAGARAAVRRLNDAGGLLGEPIRVVAWSEDCTRERAAAIADEIVELEPAVVIGHLCAGAALAAAPIYARAGRLVIVPGVRHPALTAVAHGGLVLRLSGRDDRFAGDTARFVADRFPGQGVAIVADRTRQARALVSRLTGELARRRIPLVLEETIQSGEKSYDGAAAKVKVSGAGAVIMPAQPVELGIVIASLRRAGVAAPVIGSEILAVPSLAPIAARAGADLVLMLPWTGLGTGNAADGADADPNPAARAVEARAVAAVELWAAAAARAGSVDPGRVAAAVRAGTAETVVGPLRFDEMGDAIVPSYSPHEWRDGTWQRLRY